VIASLPLPSKTSLDCRVEGGLPTGAEMVGFEPLLPPTSGKDPEEDEF
jgi:hypothetical protein